MRKKKVAQEIGLFLSLTFPKAEAPGSEGGVESVSSHSAPQAIEMALTELVKMGGGGVILKPRREGGTGPR